MWKHSKKLIPTTSNKGFIGSYQICHLITTSKSASLLQQIFHGVLQHVNLLASCSKQIFHGILRQISSYVTSNFKPEISANQNLAETNKPPKQYASVACEIAWCRQQESNPQPTDYKSVALPLRHAGKKRYPLCHKFIKMRTTYLEITPVPSKVGIKLSVAAPPSCQK